MNITDYSKLSITELCRLYGDASAALELATNRKVIDGLVADMKAAYSEAKRRDDEVAALRTELAAANAKVAELTDTCNQLAEKLMQE